VITEFFYSAINTPGVSLEMEALRCLCYNLMDLPSISLSQIPGGGTVEEDTVVYVDLRVLTGDSGNDKSCRGFLNFDISSLSGKEVVAAEMIFNSFYPVGDPYSLIEKIWVEEVYWGNDGVKVGDYDSPGVILGEYDIPTFTCSSIELRDALNQAIENGHDMFQIRLRHKGYKTNHNASADGVRYGGIYQVEFNVIYLP